MKQRLIRITTVLTLVLFAQQLWSQVPVKTEPATTPSTKQVPVKPKTIATKAQVPVVKKYLAPARIIDTVKNTDPTLNGQYKFMLSRSKTINGYKFINPYRLTTLWQNVTDTLKNERTELSSAKTKLITQAKTISELQAQNAENDTTVNSTIAEPAPTAADQISFLGITLSKASYHTIVWSIIAVLIIALVVVIARSTKSIVEAKHRTQLYEEITGELQAYKAKSSEKERKLARELQDERNKLEELKNKNL